MEDEASPLHCLPKHVVYEIRNEFDIHVTVHLNKFLIIKPTKCTNFSNLFWNETLHVSDSSSVHHQEFFTVHTAMVYVIQVCWQLASRIRMELIRMELQFHTDPARKLSANLYHIYHCCVYSENSCWWTEELSETCRVLFQNKFEKLVHLVDFIIRKEMNVRAFTVLYWKDKYRSSWLNKYKRIILLKSNFNYANLNLNSSEKQYV